MATTTKNMQVTAGNANANVTAQVTDSMPGVPCPGPAGYTYKGLRYVPVFADPIEWNSANSYEALTIVLHEGNSYTSKQAVPVGIDIANDTFWALTGNYNAQVEMYRKEVQTLSEQLIKYNKVYTDVSNMKQDGMLVEGMVVSTAGYRIEGYGGGLYIVSNSGTANEMDVIALQGGLFAHLVIGGSVDVCSLGADHTGGLNSSGAVKRAFEIASNNPIVTPGQDPIYRKSIDFPKGIYSMQTGNLIYDLPFNTGVIVNGNGSILNFSGFTGNAINVKNNFQMVEWNDFTFICDNNQITFFYSDSSGHSQGNNFNNCTFYGVWNYCFNFVGTDNNSEFAFNNCRMKGTWSSFLYVGSTGTSDQFLNYWFTNCKYWNSSNMIRVNKGGHITLVNCDFSGYNPTTQTYLFELLENSHGYGVTTFNDFGSRYELKTEYARVMKCQWDNAQINFIGSDFSSQVFNMNLPIAFTFEFNTAMSVALFENCKLYGGIEHSTANPDNCAIIRLHNTTLYYPTTVSDYFVKGRLAMKLNIETDGCYINKIPLNGWVSKSGVHITPNTCTYVENNIPENTSFTIPTDVPTLIGATFSPLPFNNGISRSISVSSIIGTVTSISGKVITMAKASDNIALRSSDRLLIGENVYTISALAGNGRQSLNITVVEDITASVGNNVSIVLYNETTTPNATVEIKDFTGPILLPNPIIGTVNTTDTDKRAYVKMELEYR